MARRGQKGRRVRPTGEPAPLSMFRKDPTARSDHSEESRNQITWSRTSRRSSRRPPERSPGTRSRSRRRRRPSSSPRRNRRWNRSSRPPRSSRRRRRERRRWRWPGRWRRRRGRRGRGGTSGKNACSLKTSHGFVVWNRGTPTWRAPGDHVRVACAQGAAQRSSRSPTRTAKPGAHWRALGPADRTHGRPKHSALAPSSTTGAPGARARGPEVGR